VPEVCVLFRDLSERHDMEPYERVEIKQYEITVNNLSYTVNAQSIGEALRKAGDLRLEDRDIVTVRVE